LLYAIIALLSLVVFQYVKPKPLAARIITTAVMVATLTGFSFIHCITVLVVVMNSSGAWSSSFLVILAIYIKPPDS
jgi:hypothetical protein